MNSIFRKDDSLILGVRQEALVGAFGLPEDRPYVSIKGDPSLRETVQQRPRQHSRLDKIASQVLEACANLLRETGVYAIYVGFNSSEVRTESIFNPFAYEIHDAEDLIKPGYVERHFVPVPYGEKKRAIALDTRDDPDRATKQLSAAALGKFDGKKSRRVAAVTARKNRRNRAVLRHIAQHRGLLFAQCRHFAV